MRSARCENAARDLRWAAPRSDVPPPYGRHVSGWVPPRLRPLLGDDLASIDESRLTAIVGLVEDVDLDFKREPWATTEGGAKEAAYDVAAFANSAGGLIVVGVDEDGRGHCSEFIGVDPSIDVALWLHQIVAARVAPPAVVSHRRVQVGEQQILLFAVRPSTAGPHAVAVGDGALRYPTRLGSLRRYLTEAEVGDRYRRRLAATRDIAQQLDDLLGEVETTVDTTSEDRAAQAWLALGLVPDVPGALELRRGVDAQWLEWIRPELRQYPCFGPREVDQSTFGFQSIDVHDGRYGGGAYLVAGRFWTDGRGLLLLGYLGGRGDRGVQEDRVAVYDEHLVGDVINGLAVLAHHASRTGGSGAVNLTARLGWSDKPLVLAEHRSQFPGPVDGLRSVPRTGISRRSADLDVVLDGRARLGVVRLVAGDLLSSFGWPEPQQITAELQLVRYRTHRQWWQWAENWAGANGVAMIDRYDE